MSNQLITLRQATLHDAETIADLSRSTFYETFAAQNSIRNMELFLNEQFTRSRLINEVGADGNTFLLASYKGDLAGYVKLREGEKPRQIKKISALEIARIYVVKEMIGKGIGRALMEASINTARERNLQLIWLAVWEHNTRAFDFYKKWGFEIFGSQVFLLGMDIQKDWLMKKNLEAPIKEKNQ